MQKKFLMLLTALFLLSGVAYAEQPAAEQYRQMFKSGTFYVEYKIRSYTDYRMAEITEKSLNSGLLGFLNIFGGNNKVKIGDDRVHVIVDEKDNRLVGTIFEEKRSGRGFGLFGLVGNLGGGKKKSVVYDVMYKDGNYYRFSTSHGWRASFFGVSRTNELRAFMLPVGEIKADYLNPDEHWDTIEHDLALPDELSVFAWQDRFHVAKPGQQAPQFKESLKLTEEKQEYDCDRYVSDIKTLDGQVIAQVTYDYLYQDGKLVAVRTYFNRNGVATFVGDIAVEKLEETLPEDAFKFKKKIPVYAAGVGDANDLLGNKVQIGTLGDDKK
ncbi:MAG: hypothetical protein IJ849_07025 [Selenomonadaceae bacterium]|nr:hypothetical protein [Selenomonadaceae bacterium]